MNGGVVTVLLCCGACANRWRYTARVFLRKERGEDGGLVCPNPNCRSTAVRQVSVDTLHPGVPDEPLL